MFVFAVAFYNRLKNASFFCLLLKNYNFFSLTFNITYCIILFVKMFHVKQNIELSLYYSISVAV